MGKYWKRHQLHQIAQKHPDSSGIGGLEYHCQRYHGGGITAIQLKNGARIIEMIPRTSATLDCALGMLEELASIFINSGAEWVRLGLVMLVQFLMLFGRCLASLTQMVVSVRTKRDHS